MIDLKKYLKYTSIMLYLKEKSLSNLKICSRKTHAEQSVTDNAAGAVVIINDSSTKCDSATFKWCHQGVLCIWN